MRRFIILAIVLSSTIAGVASSQKIRVSAEADTLSGLIGDQIGVTLKAEHESGLTVLWPSFPDSLGGLETIRRGKIDTSASDAGVLQTQKLFVAAFDSGRYEIPALTFLYSKSKSLDDPQAVSTDPIYLTYNTVEVDTSKAIKDIKPPLHEPWTILEAAKFILISLAIAAVSVGIVLLILRLTRNKRKPAKVFKKAELPPHVEALTALKKLDKLKLWQSGKIKEYYVHLTEILRRYIGRAFNIPALEMPSSEIIDNLDAVGIGEELKRETIDLLTLADLVKFAKSTSSEEENVKYFATVRKFVEATMPKPNDDRREEANSK